MKIFKFKIIPRIILTIAILFIAINTVLASTAYFAIFRIVESSSNSYTNLPIIVDSDNATLAANGDISSDGLNAFVFNNSVSLPTMIADDKTLFVTNVSANSTYDYLYTTGTSSVESMPIIVGNGGYITIPYNVDLELGQNYLIAINDTYVDTSGESNIAYKEHSFRLYTDTGYISYAVLDGSDNETVKVSVEFSSGSFTSLTVLSNDTSLVLNIDEDIDSDTSYPVPLESTDIVLLSDAVPYMGSFSMSPMTESGDLTEFENNDSDYGDLWAVCGGGDTATGTYQIFESNTSHYLHELKVFMNRGDYWDYNDPTGYDFTMYIKNVDEAGYPVGTNSSNYITSEDFDVVDLNTTGSWITWTLSSDIQILSETRYAIFIRANFTFGNPPANDPQIYWALDNNENSYENGDVGSWNSGWARREDNLDCIFQEWGYETGLQETLSYCPENIISGTILPDLQETQDGVITWGTNPVGISATNMEAPQVTTLDYSDLSTTANTVKLNGNLDSLGDFTPVYVYFEYGTTTSYGNSTSPQTKTAVAVFNDTINIISNTTYHYRADAVYALSGQNAYIIIKGEDKTVNGQQSIVAPVISQYWTPVSGAGSASTNKTIMPTQPTNWYASASNISNLPFYQTFDDAATVINPNNRDTAPHQTTWVLYLLAIMATAMAAGFGTLLFTGSTMMGLFSTSFFMGLGVSMTIVSGWMVFIVVVAGLGLWYLARST